MSARFTARGHRLGENFNDPQLSALIDGMLIANQDLALAGLQWREAMLEAGLAQGNLTPDLAANLSGRNTGRCGRDYAAGKLPCRAL